MEFYNVIKSRRTIRDFTNKPVEMEKVKKILTTGLMAPTHDHLRNWEFVILTDNNMIEQILNEVPKMKNDNMNMTSKSHMQQSKSPQQRMYNYSMPIQYEMLYNSGCIILPFFKQTSSLYKPETVSTLNAFASIWCCIENIMLAATAEGLACAMRIPTRKEPEHVAKILQQPPNYIFPCYLALGYGAQDAVIPEQVQHDIESKMHFNKW